MSEPKECDPAIEREETLAQDRFLIMVQSAIQNVLNDKGLKYRDLARRMRVSEARISQLFSDDASNMTVKTIAKVFYHLDATPILLSAQALELKLSAAGGGRDQQSSAWVVSGDLADLQLDVWTDVSGVADQHKDVVSPRATPRDWAAAEIAIEQRTRAA